MEAEFVSNLIALHEGSLNIITIFDKAFKTKNMKVMCMLSKFLPADYDVELSMKLLRIESFKREMEDSSIIYSLGMARKRTS
jgi:hypothetical protein